MDAVTYPDERVAKTLNESFVPVKLDVSANTELAKRFNVTWTPTFLVLDGNERESFRAFGWLPPEEFKAQAEFALGKALFDTGDYAAAKERFDHVLKHHEKTFAAPDACYWYGVADYKQTGRKETLLKMWSAVMEKYPQHPWALKVSFIRPK